MFKRILSWFRRAAPTPAPSLAEAETEDLPPVDITILDACSYVLRQVETDRLLNPGSLTNYDDIVARIWARLPDVIRESDTPVNRAEFASAVRAAVRLYDDVTLWMAD